MEETVHKAAEGARPPAVRISDVVTNGDLSVIAVRAILEDIADDLRACYENRWMDDDGRRICRFPVA
jgi:hypothetical protein